MSIFDQGSLEASSLADLHAIASELSIDGYRRLRKAELIEAILARQTGEPIPAADALASETEEESEDRAAEPDEAPSGRRRRGRRGGRGRGSRESASDSDDTRVDGTSSDGESPAVSTETDEAPAEPEPEQLVEGVVELLPGGS